MIRKTVFFSAVLTGAIWTVPTQAATIHYTIDSFSDGVNGSIVGGANSAFELYGMGYTQVDNTLFFGFNTNLPIGGDPNPTVLNGSIAWGDMFLNFSDQPFEDAIAAGDVYGVRFDAANDSYMPTLGLYQVQATANVTVFNSGFLSLADYQQTVLDAGGTPSMGAVLMDGSYLSNTELPQNVIADGTLISDQVQFIEDFSTVGFDADFGFDSVLSEVGTYTYGFSVDASDLPLDDFIAHVFAECVNDALALRGTVTAASLTAPLPSKTSATVSEPLLGLPLLVLGLAYGVKHPRKTQ
ncbi:MAG: XDD3 family exosortase-dependent surface protein [Cyanobacteria bacterium P01_H01_bin.58]